MDLSVNDENILGHITEFKEFHDEHEIILKEIRDFKKKYQTRISELKLNMEKKEKIILDYMRTNNHPGLNYKGNLITMLKIQQGKRISRKQKTEEIQKILNKYQITSSNPLYHELRQIFLQSTEREKIKLKKKTS